MSIQTDAPLDGSPPQTGSLVFLGTGISGIAQITTEAELYIRNAEIVFYHATSDVMAAHIATLNNNLVDLFKYYGENKKRRTTYVQMAELILREMRKGKRVVAAFHGHPGFLVMAVRRASAIARSEGFQVRILPGISSVDCMVADLFIDPGMFGLQIVKAGSYLRGNALLAKSGHVALLQVDSVGDTTYSFTGYKHHQVDVLFDKLIDEYGGQQEAVFYTASRLPGTEAVIRKQLLSDFRGSSATATIGTGILYIPPQGLTLESVLQRQAFRNRDPYGEFERRALQQLDEQETLPISNISQSAATTVS